MQRAIGYSRGTRIAARSRFRATTLVLFVLYGRDMPPEPEHRYATIAAELQRALNLAVNVLIIGARESDVASVRYAISDPLIGIGDALTNEFGGTCVVPDAGRLMRDQQKALRRRLERGPRLRVVSLSPVSLYSFVESGQFDETLFYRLNIITVDLTSG
jgi:Sigma-54 interaction domain